MCLCGLRYCTLLLLLYAPPFWNASIFTKLIVLRSEVCSDWPAIQCVVIGRIPQACDGNVTPLTVLWCRVPVRRHKNNKTHYKRGICCIQWGHNNDLYCLCMHCVASRHIKITKVGIAPLYRNSLCAQLTGYSQVQETVLCKMRCTHSNIWVELFWNSVVSFFFTTKHSVSRTWRQQQYYSENNSSTFLQIELLHFCIPAHRQMDRRTMPKSSFWQKGTPQFFFLSLFSGHVALIHKIHIYTV